MLEKTYLLFPLLAGLLYAAGTLGLNAASRLGVDSIRATVACNVCTVVAFLAFYDWGSFPSLPDPLWPVLLLGALFVLGQIFTILAVATGEISSVGPVFGVKVVFVAFLAAWAFGAPVDGFTWTAAILSVAGIACLQVTDRPYSFRKDALAILYAFLAAVGFAGFDAMTQYWSPILGFGRLVPPAIALATLISLFFLRRRPAGSGRFSRHALRYLAVGAGFFTVQALILIRSIGVYGDAAGANVAYSVRGLWGILLVWWVGSWFGNMELSARSPQVLRARILGSVLVCAATVLVFWC
jgi:drug/metabolite transporter (DMT)-like permease